MITVSLWLLWFWSAMPSEAKTPESVEQTHKNTLDSLMVLRKEIKDKIKNHFPSRTLIGPVIL